MGMFTQFVFGVELKKNTPQEVIDILKYMTDDNKTGREEIETPAHPLFNTDRWPWMFFYGSYYHDWKTTRVFEFDDISNTWFLTVVCNLKNYGGEIQKFVDWIAPYVETNGFAGFEQYEEFEDPTLLYILNGKPYWKTVEFFETIEDENAR